MLLFSINRSRGYENPSLDIIVIELYSTGVFPLEEAHEHCFQIQSAIYVVILISFQCYCGECSGYIVVILPLLTFYLCSAYILYMVYYMEKLLLNLAPHEPLALMKNLPCFDDPVELYVLLVGAINLCIHDLINYSLLKVVKVELRSGPMLNYL
jgi:hypothetical protein